METAEENLLAGTLGGVKFSWRSNLGKADNEKVAEALEAGANREVTFAGLTPLMIAAKKGSNILKILLNNSANPNTVICDEGGGVLGMGAVGERVRRSLGMSVREGEDIIFGSLMRLGRSALHIACEFGHDECVKELLEKDADPNLKDKNGYTPLMCGLKSRAIIHDMSVKRRLEEPNPELRDLYAASARPSIMDMLISSGADLKARNDDGDSALDIADKIYSGVTNSRENGIIMEIIKILESPYQFQATEDRLALAKSSLPGPPSEIGKLEYDTLIKLAGFITPDMIRQAEMARLKAEAESKEADNPARPLRQGWRRQTSRRTGETYYVSPSGTSTFDHPGYQPEPEPEPEPEPSPPESARLGKKRRRKKSISSKKRRMKTKRKSKRRKSKKKKSSRRRIRKKK